MMDADSLSALLGDLDNEDEWQRTNGQQLQSTPTVSSCSQLDLPECQANGPFDGRITDADPLRDACDNMLPGFVPDLRAARPESRSVASESRLATAREAQRRFRQRHKAKSLSIESQLASTTAALRESKARQQQLESRNALLEKLASLNPNQTEAETVAADKEYERLFTACDTKASDKGPALAVSVWGEQYTMGVHEVAKLSLKEFCTLWTDYVRKLAEYLLQLYDNDEEVTEQLQQLTVEASALVFCLKLYNPEAQNAFVAGKMDEGKPRDEHPGPAMYSMLLRTLELSDAQVSDLLQLRRIWLAKVAQLSLQRDHLLQQMTNSADMSQHPGHVMTSMSRLATALKENAAENYRVYNRTVCALLRGVFSTKQHAVVIVYGYPNILCTEDFLEHLSEVHQEPNKEALLVSMRAEAETPMFTKSCSDFDEYVELVASNILHHYVPLSAEQRALGSSTEPPKATSSLERQLLLY